MSYESGVVVSYNLAGLNADASRVIKGPKGKRGRVEDVLVSATTAYNEPGDGASASLSVGDGTTADMYASMTHGAIAANSATAASDLATSLPVADADIPADSEATITYTQTTGTGATGAGDHVVLIRWF